MMVFDVISGYIAASINNEVSSTEMRQGLFHKGGESLCIFLGLACEYGLDVFGNDLLAINVNIQFCIVICAYIFITELISVLENIGKINPAFEKALCNIIGIDKNKFGGD